jgi:hypothetical protein
MIKIDFNKKIQDLMGEDTGESINKIFANSIATTQSDDPIKWTCWARDIYKVGVIEVDKSDADKLLKAAKEAKSLFDVGRAQIAEIIQAAIDESEKKDKKK